MFSQSHEFPLAQVCCYECRSIRAFIVTDLPLFSGFGAVMAETPSEAAIQESQVVPSKSPLLHFLVLA